MTQSKFSWILNVEMEEDASASKAIDRLLGELVCELDKKGYLISWQEKSKLKEKLLKLKRKNFESNCNARQQGKIKIFRKKIFNQKICKNISTKYFSNFFLKII